MGPAASVHWSSPLARHNELGGSRPRSTMLRYIDYCRQQMRTTLAP